MQNLTDETEAFRARIKEARDGAGHTQETMAKALGIPLDRYKKYENRSAMPAMVLARFALIVRRDGHWLLTGAKATFPEGSHPRLRVIVPKSQPRRKPQR